MLTLKLLMVVIATLLLMGCYSFHGATGIWPIGSCSWQIDGCTAGRK